MTTVLSQASPSDLIGQIIAQGIQQNFAPGVEQGMSRGRLQQGISQIQDLAKNKNLTPQELILELAKYSQDIPERAYAPITQSLTGLAKGNVAPSISSVRSSVPQQNQENLPVGQVPEQNNPQQQPQQPTALQEGQGITLGKYLPYDLKGQITPEQRSDILDQVRRQGGDVDFTRQQIDDYNQGKINQVDLANKNVDKSAAQTERQLGFEDEVKKRIDRQLPANTPESEKNIYYNMVNKELPKHKDFTSAWQAISKKVADFKKNYETYVTSIPEGGLMGITDSQRKSLQNSAKPLIKEDPLAYNILEGAMLQKGNSLIDASKTLNPLPQKFENIIKDSKDYRDLIYPKPSFFHEFTEDEMLNNIEDAMRGQREEIPNLEDKLRENWNENLSLLNIYSDFKTRGWFPETIRELLDKLSDKFSSQQEVERTQLNQNPRIPIYDIMKS